MRMKIILSLFILAGGYLFSFAGADQFPFDSHHYSVFIKPDGSTDIIQESSGIENQSRNKIYFMGPFLSSSEIKDIHGIHWDAKIPVEFGDPFSSYSPHYNIASTREFNRFISLSFKTHTVPGDRYYWFVHGNSAQMPLKIIGGAEGKFYVFYWQPTLGYYPLDSTLDVVLPIIYNPDKMEVYKNAIFTDPQTSKKYGSVKFFPPPWQYQLYLSVSANAKHRPMENAPFYMLIRRELFPDSIQASITENLDNPYLEKIAASIEESEKETAEEIITPPIVPDKAADVEIVPEQNPFGQNMTGDGEKPEMAVPESKGKTGGIIPGDADTAPALSPEAKGESKPEYFVPREPAESPENQNYKILFFQKTTDIREAGDMITGSFWKSGVSLFPEAHYFIHEKSELILKVNDWKELKKLIKMSWNYFTIRINGYASLNASLSQGTPVTDFRLQREDDGFLTILFPENNRKYAYLVVTIDNHFYQKMDYRKTYAPRYYSVHFLDDKIYFSQKISGARLRYILPVRFQFSIPRQYQSAYARLFPVQIMPENTGAFNGITMMPENPEAPGRIILDMKKYSFACGQSGESTTQVSEEEKKSCEDLSSILNGPEILADEEERKGDPPTIYPFSELSGLEFAMKSPEKDFSLLRYPLFPMVMLVSDLRSLEFYPEMIVFFYLSLIYTAVFVLSLFLIHPVLFGLFYLLFWLGYWISGRVSTAGESAYFHGHLFPSFQELFFPDGIRMVSLFAGFLVSLNAYLIPIRFARLTLQRKKEMQLRKDFFRDPFRAKDPPFSENSLACGFAPYEAKILMGQLSEGVISYIFYLHMSGVIRVESIFPLRMVKEQNRGFLNDKISSELWEILPKGNPDLKFLRRFMDLTLERIIDNIWDYHVLKTQNCYHHKFQSILSVYRGLPRARKEKYLSQNLAWLLAIPEFRKIIQNEANLLPASHRVARLIRNSGNSENSFADDVLKLRTEISRVISLVNIKDILNEK